MQMRCLSVRGIRACWLLCFRKWLLRAVACWHPARLGRPRFASRRKRGRTEAEASFQTENRRRRLTNGHVAGWSQIPSARSMGPRGSRGPERGRQVGKTIDDLPQLLGAGFPILQRSWGPCMAVAAFASWRATFCMCKPSKKVVLRASADLTFRSFRRAMMEHDRRRTSIGASAPCWTHHLIPRVYHGAE